MSLPNIGACALIALVTVQLLNMIYVFFDPRYEGPATDLLSVVTTLTWFISIFIMWIYGFCRAYLRHKQDSKAETIKNLFYALFAPVVSIFYFLYLDKQKITVRKQSDVWLKSSFVILMVLVFYTIVTLFVVNFVRDNQQQEFNARCGSIK